MIVALVLGFLFIRALVGQKTPNMLMALLLYGYELRTNRRLK